MEPFNTVGPGRIHDTLEALGESHDLKSSLKRKLGPHANDDSDNPQLKLPRQGSYHGTGSRAPGVEPGYLVVHQVKCDGAGEHYNYIPSAIYLDVPQLFATDSKASTLRGKKPLPSIDEFLDNHPGITISITKHYSCQKYFGSVEDGFERLHIPKLDSSVLAKIRTSFFILKQDGEPAQAMSENMQILSRELQSALSAFGLQYVKELNAPYLELYQKMDLF
jgi:hypothetical protein